MHVTGEWTGALSASVVTAHTIVAQYMTVRF